MTPPTGPGPCATAPRSVSREVMWTAGRRVRNRPGRRGQPDRERCGQDPEAERGLEGEGFAVDPDLDGAGRPDLELGAVHSSNPEYRLALPDGLESRELLRVRQSRHHQRDQPEEAVVQVVPGEAAAQPTELVGVVRDQDQLGRGGLAAVRKVEAEVERGGVRAEQLGQHLRRGLHLGVAVVVGLDDLGVDTHGRVVHEHAAVHLGQVDDLLDPFA